MNESSKFGACRNVCVCRDIRRANRSSSVVVLLFEASDTKLNVIEPQATSGQQWQFQ